MKVTFDIPPNLAAAVNDAVAAVLAGAAVQGPGDLGFGFDQFGTAYTSAADRERGENLRQYGTDAAARDSVLQPGMLDMRTYTADDLMFAGMFMQEIGPLLQGPRDIEKAFNNWWHDGSSPLPELPVTAEILTRKHEGFDWSTYHGKVRALVPRLGP